MLSVVSGRVSRPHDVRRSVVEAANSVQRRHSDALSRAKGRGRKDLLREEFARLYVFRCKQPDEQTRSLGGRTCWGWVWGRRWTGWRTCTCTFTCTFTCTCLLRF